MKFTLVLFPLYPQVRKMGLTFRRLFTAFTIILSSTVFSQDPVGALLDRLRVSPLDLSVLPRLEAAKDPRVLPALRQAFEEHPVKSELQYIAVSLIHLGDHDERYFQFLSKYAEAAIGSDAPPVLAQDEKGDSIRGKLNPEFEAWARKRGIDWKVAAGEQMYTMPEDVKLLGEARDSRALPLLRRGLQSKNDVVALMATQELALLNDAASVPTIIRECVSSRPSRRRLMLSILAIFTDPEALRIIDQSLTDPELRKTYLKLREAAKRLE